MQHKGTTTIVTDNLILRQIGEGDIQDFYNLLIDEGVQKYLCGIPIYTGVDMSESYITKNLVKKYHESNFYDWGIALKDTNQLVGRITVYKQDEDRRMADLVWYIIKGHRGKGYTTEAAKAVVQYLQQIGYERIEAFANVDNISSQRVMEKAGFEFEGILRKYDMNRDGSLYDAKMYSVIKKD